MTQPPDWDQPTAGQPGLLPTAVVSSSPYFGDAVASSGRAEVAPPPNGHALPPLTGPTSAPPTGNIPSAVQPSTAAVPAPNGGYGVATGQAPAARHTSAPSHGRGAGDTPAARPTSPPWTRPVEA